MLPLDYLYVSAGELTRYSLKLGFNFSDILSQVANITSSEEMGRQLPGYIWVYLHYGYASETQN